MNQQQLTVRTFIDPVSDQVDLAYQIALGAWLQREDGMTIRQAAVEILEFVLEQQDDPKAMREAIFGALTLLLQLAGLPQNVSAVSADKGAA